MPSNVRLLPGFSAEAALDRPDRMYALKFKPHSAGLVVIPQFPKFLRCAAAIVGAAATCELTAVAGPAGAAACVAATAAAAAVCD